MRPAKNSFLALFAATSLMVPAISPTAEINSSPEDAVLVSRVLNPPSLAYKGHLMMSSWSGKSSRAEDVTVYFSPPNRYRLEFLAPNGTVDRAVISDTGHQRIVVMRNGQTVQDVTAPFVPAVLTHDEEKNLLFQNYRVSVRKAEPILGRSTWIVQLTPLATGKPSHQMRVDRQTNVILEEKQFSNDSSIGSLMRFTEFHPGASFPDSLFLDEQELKGAEEVASSNLARESTVKSLPGGFTLESVDYFDVTGKSVRHVRYTDGIVPLSLFETPLPIKIPDQGSQLASQNPTRVGFSTQGRVYTWKKKRQYYTLIGDLQESLLQDIAKDLH